MEPPSNAYIAHAEAQYLAVVVDGLPVTFVPKDIQTVTGPLLQSRIQPVLKRQLQGVSVSEVTSRTFEERCSPPSSVGSLGDIWVDVVSMDIYTYDNGWLQWPGNEKSIPHPIIRNSRLIHTGDKAFIKWVTSSNRSKIMKKNPYLKNLIPREVFNHVISLRQEETQPSASNKRKAENELNYGAQLYYYHSAFSVFISHHLKTMYPADFDLPSLDPSLGSGLLTLSEDTGTSLCSPQTSSFINADLESIIGSMQSFSVSPTVQPMHKGGLKLDACCMHILSGRHQFSFWYGDCQVVQWSPHSSPFRRCPGRCSS